jgi:hypothetical protein
VPSRSDLVTAHPRALLQTDGALSASDQSTAAISLTADWWTLFGRIADAASIISFLLILFAFRNILKHRRVWTRLRGSDRKAGAAIAMSFSNKHDVVFTHRLVTKLQDECGLKSPDAKALLQRFVKLKILNSLNTPEGLAYTPRLTWLTNEAVLFVLWK